MGKEHTYFAVVLLLLASFASPRFFLRGQNNLSFEHRNLHNLIQPSVLLPELLDLVVVDQQTGPVSEVKWVVAGPHVHHVLLLGPAGGHHQLSFAVHLGVFVELRVYLLLPARHHRPEIPNSATANLKKKKRKDKYEEELSGDEFNWGNERRGLLGKFTFLGGRTGGQDCPWRNVLVRLSAIFVSGWDGEDDG